jgi:hypothetical protein
MHSGLPHMPYSFAHNRPAFLRSATNYLLGLSSVPFKPFLAATFAAMAVWGPLYASIGAASRGVLKSRGDVGAIFAGERPSLAIAAVLISWIPRLDRVEQLRTQPTPLASLAHYYAQQGFTADCLGVVSPKRTPDMQQAEVLVPVQTCRRAQASTLRRERRWLWL